MSSTHDLSDIRYTPLNPVRGRQVKVSDTLDWLRAGWHTFTQHKTAALTFGSVFALIGAAISYASINNPQMAFTFWSGFLLIAPILSMAVYHLAQLDEKDRPAGLGGLLSVLRSNLGNTLLLVLGLALVMIAWIRVSSLVVALYFGTLPSQIEISAFLSLDNLGMLATLGAVGAAFAIVMFALLAWSMPMLARGRVDFVTAMVSSLRTVVNQPVPMLAWGGIVAALTIASMATLFVAFAMVFPWLGFATWEAYKAIFESE